MGIHAVARDNVRVGIDNTLRDHVLYQEFPELSDIVVIVIQHILDARIQKADTRNRVSAMSFLEDYVGIFHLELMLINYSLDVVHALQIPILPVNQRVKRRPRKTPCALAAVAAE